MEFGQGIPLIGGSNAPQANPAMKGKCFKVKRLDVEEVWYVADQCIAVEGLQVMLLNAYRDEGIITGAKIVHYPLIGFYHVPLVAYPVPCPEWWEKRETRAVGAGE